MPHTPPAPLTSRCLPLHIQQLMHAHPATFDTPLPHVEAIHDMFAGVALTRYAICHRPQSCSAASTAMARLSCLNVDAPSLPRSAASLSVYHKTPAGWNARQDKNQRRNALELCQRHPAARYHSHTHSMRLNFPLPINYAPPKERSTVTVTCSRVLLSAHWATSTHTSCARRVVPVQQAATAAQTINTPTAERLEATRTAAAEHSQHCNLQLNTAHLLGPSQPPLLVSEGQPLGQGQS
jgi:hypothetical protein